MKSNSGNFSEKQIQEFIWEHREDWPSLIVQAEIPSMHRFSNDLSDLTPARLMFNRAIRRFSEMDESIRGLQLLGSEVPLSRTGSSTIRADFLAAEQGTPGIAIVELKRSKQSEREAFTELLGYASHLSCEFPMMTRDDIRYVLIAPMESRIVREAVVYSSLIEGKHVYALIPEFADSNRLDSLRLCPWVPSIEEVSRLASTVFDPKNFKVSKSVWEHQEGTWNARPNESVPHWIKCRMNRISAHAAQEMESRRIHGFAYASQLWPELEKQFMFTNSLVVVGLNPFEIGHDLFLHKNGLEPTEHIPIIGTNVTLADLIPCLSNSTSEIHQETNYLEDQAIVWHSQLFLLGQSIVKRATMAFDSSPQIDHGFLNWDNYQRQMFEDITCENFDVRPTGLVRELFWEVTHIDQQLLAHSECSDHPIHGDSFDAAVDVLSSHHYFRLFCERMFGINQESFMEGNDRSDN